MSDNNYGPGGGTAAPGPATGGNGGRTFPIGGPATGGSGSSFAFFIDGHQVSPGEFHVIQLLGKQLAALERIEKLLSEHPPQV